MPNPPEDLRLTEQRNPATTEIDQLSPLDLVDVINAEDDKVAPAVHAERLEIARAIEITEKALRRGGHLIYVGAGTSGRLGVLDASEMPPTYSVDPTLVQGVIAGGAPALTRAIEGAEDHPEDGASAMDQRGVTERDFVLGIAASGTTPYVHGALQRAKELGAATGLLLCTPPAKEYLDAYDVVIAPLVGPEVVTGSTRMKAGTATKLVLNTISTGAMIRLGKTYGNLMVDLRATNRKLVDRSQRILMEMLEVDRDESAALLRRSGGSVKLAIALHLTDGDVSEAQRRLDQAGGRLGEILVRQGTNDQ
ncbi:MAG: N-acetylmuramic acid 6-phosphate etherase [Gemmatimonadota bacterium]|nr:N-acetylmuramic acid 6-phosphate etherase [Gemmatimonadota bacterium]